MSSGWGRPRFSGPMRALRTPLQRKNVSWGKEMADCKITVSGEFELTAPPPPFDNFSKK